MNRPLRVTGVYKNHKRLDQKQPVPSMEKLYAVRPLSAKEKEAHFQVEDRSPDHYDTSNLVEFFGGVKA